MTIIKYGRVDEVIMLTFSDEMMKMPYDVFISELLVKRYNVCHIIMGENYTCGFMGAGNPGNIAPLCEKLGITCEIIKEVKIDGQTVSSTLIRKLIASGDTARAEQLLGHKLEEIYK